MQQRKARGLALVGVFALAAAVRFWGLRWGAPERFDFYIDEMQYVIRHALKLSLANPEPTFLNYPSFLAYTIAILIGLASRIGIELERWQVHVLGRSIIAAYGAASAPIAFRIADALGAPFAGAALAALGVAILPDHIWESHVAVTDVMMTFWVMVLVLTSLRAIERSKPRSFVACGVALGLAVGSKYTAAIAAVAPLLAIAYARLTLRQRAEAVGILITTSLAACFCVTPYSFLRPARLLQALAFESAHVQGSHPGFSLAAPGFQYHRYVYQLVAAFPFGMGFALYGAGLVGAGWTIVTRARSASVLLSVAAAFFALTGSFRFTPLRYYLPIIVALTICGGCWLGSWWASGPRWRRAIAVATAVVTFGYTAVYACTTTARYSRDTRIQAARWLEKHIRPEQRVAAVGNRSYLAIPRRHRFAFTVFSKSRAFKLRSIADYDVVQITSLNFQRAYRSGSSKVLGNYRQLREGKSRFRLVKRFEPWFLNRRLYERLDPMFGAYFVSPTIEIYQSRRAKE